MAGTGVEVDDTSQVGSLFPAEYKLVSVPSAMLVQEAVRLMIEKHYSQLPVVDEGQLRGVFSLWGLARHLIAAPRVLVGDLPVGDLVERFPRVTVEDDLHEVMEKLERHEALLVDSPQGLQAMATTWDFLVCFYRLAHPYLMLREIELALRDVIRATLDADQLAECIRRALSRKYEHRVDPRLPRNLEDLEFDDYRMLIGNDENWVTHFGGLLGNNQSHVNARLESLGKIRNKVFHFRGGPTVAEYETLTAEREWLVSRALARRTGSSDG